MNRRFENREEGSVLVIAMSSFAMAAVFFVVMFGSVASESRRVDLDVDRAQAQRYAEGILEIAETQIIEATADYRVLAPTGNADPFVVMTGTETIDGVTGTWQVRRMTFVNASGDEEPYPVSQMTDPDTGLKSILEPWDLVAEARFRSSRVRVIKRIQMQKTPIFQFLAFYSDDLEINPGPNMTLNGRIHANGDLYLTAGNSLSIDSTYCRTAGDMHRERKDAGSNSGWVKIKDLASGSMVKVPDQSDLAALGIPSTSGFDSTFGGWDLNGDGAFNLSGEMAPFAPEATHLFGGTLQTQEHGVQTMAHPTIQSIQAFDPAPGGTGGDYVQNSSGGYDLVAAGTGTHNAGYFNDNAGMRIIDDRVFDGVGNDITALMPSQFLTETTFYDARENRDVTMTVVDVGRLGDMDGNPATLDPSPYYPSNGLVFAYRSDSAPGAANGVLLTNGREINTPSVWNLSEYGSGGAYAGQTPPSGAYAFGAKEKLGLTVVSPSPVFVHGDYNVDSKKASAVITDTVSLLSSAWDFSKTSTSSLPTAATTQFNLAFITGNQKTQGHSYNGGFENLPRFHENWSGKTCKIRGSFVNTWQSAIATGSWFYGGKNYQAPNRDWGFDTDFDTDLPPFTPMVIDTINLGIDIRG